MASGSSSTSAIQRPSCSCSTSIRKIMVQGLSLPPGLESRAQETPQAGYAFSGVSGGDYVVTVALRDHLGPADRLQIVRDDHLLGAERAESVRHHPAPLPDAVIRPFAHMSNTRMSWS